MSTQHDTSQVKRFKCTYKDCDLHFPTKKAMRLHKYKEPSHDFCHKCNKDFDSWETLLEHKASTPEVHHLACRICGDEFRTPSGLRRHVELNHKIDQKLKCIGCDEQFPRASMLIEHLEFDHCQVISSTQFYAHIIHKNLITDYLKQGGNLEEFMEKNASYRATIDDANDGGVNLIDGYDESQDLSAYEAFQQTVTISEVPERIVAASSSSQKTQTIDEPKNTPAEPSTPAWILKLEAKLKELELSTPKTAASGAFKWQGMDAINEVERRLREKGELPAVEKSGTPSNNDGPSSTVAKADSQPVDTKPSVWGGNSATVLFSNDKPASTTKVDQMVANPTAQADEEPPAEDIVVWGGNAAKTLFPNAQASAPTQTPHKPSFDREEAEKRVKNMMSNRVWDPMCDEWAPQHFYNSVKNVYHCPFPCERTFALPIDLAKHIIEEHKIKAMQCPKCFRSFKSCTGLVAHCESTTSRCTINRNPDFAIYLDNLTGGFLNVEEKIRPDHLHNPTIMVKLRPDEPPVPWKYPEVQYLQFEPSNPPDYKKPEEKKVVEIGGGREKKAGCVVEKKGNW